MFKQVVLLKRRPGMTTEEFKHYYENYHSKLHERVGKGEPFMPTAQRYVRRYITPERNPITGEVIDPGFDCLWNVVEFPGRLRILYETYRKPRDIAAYHRGRETAVRYAQQPRAERRGVRLASGAESVLIMQIATAQRKRAFDVIALIRRDNLTPRPLPGEAPRRKRSAGLNAPGARERPPRYFATRRGLVSLWAMRRKPSQGWHGRGTTQANVHATPEGEVPVRLWFRSGSIASGSAKLAGSRPASLSGKTSIVLLGR